MTVEMETIVKDNIVNLYMNGPLVNDSRPGTYYIWLPPYEGVNQPYFITATTSDKPVE